MKSALYPFRFKPVYKDYLWGGMRIPTTYHRTDVSGEVCAESWEISDHDDGMSVLTNGPLAGRSLRELLQEHGTDILGTGHHDTRFPLLFKLIDAKRKLSVQVHPNDETAEKYGGEAKTEMWYMLGDNDAQVFCEFKDGVTKEHFLTAIDEHTCADQLREVPVEQSSLIFVPGGRVHAIDEDCLILEIQQNSNTTYRIYDWDRVGTDGKPRELHIDKAIEVINWDDHQDPRVSPGKPVEHKNGTIQDLLACDYFRLEKISFSETFPVKMSGRSFHALFIERGELSIEWDGGTEKITAGTSILVPAALDSYTLQGNAVVLRTTLPN